MVVPVISNKIKYLVAVGEKSLRTQIIQLIRKNFVNSTIYEAKDGGDALHKIESDQPQILILSEKLTRRSAEQIIASLYQDPRTQGIQTIFIGSPDKLVDYPDLIAKGSLQVVTLDSNFGPLVAAIYKAINRIDPQDQEFKIRYMQKGEIFLHEGEQGTNLFLLLKGRLTAFTGDPDSPKVLGQVIPGEFVGEMAYINNEPRVASVRADEDCEMVEFQTETFDQILYRKPSWMKAMLQTLSRRVKILNLNRSQSTAKK